MELKELKKLLQEPYKTANWRTLLGHVFEYVQFLDNPIVIPTGDARVNQLKQYGTIRLSDGKNLALFELTLNDNVNLIRNRVGLNELVKKYIDQDSYHGILSIFEQGKEDYRFTFTARNTEFDDDHGFIDKDTDTKRFTYILGANESCRTAAERFDALSKTNNKDIKAVEDAFNVEKLSKKFFKEYIEQFDSLVAYLKSKPTYYQAIFENDETATRNFVKRFMGRLVFLKFIQKKGWLGVPVTESGWNHGDYQFLENQFKAFESKSIFVSHFLNPLFFEALNVGNRPHDEFQNRGYKIPYLSGGLFDNDHPKENRIDFEERELTNLFDFFERYNFTIDENDLHDKEVGIDPEMLGHIFENLLEDNKDKGAFYTPKEIVRYMCQESLKEYLKTYLEKEKLWPEDETASQNLSKTIAAFVEKKETAAILRYDKELATALRDVKICDPAIGSGAFPMGLLNEIFTMIKNLHDESPDRVGDVWGMQGDTWQPNVVKQNIIQNSIYGVDIEAGAVDIARLRFWLSLVIEETEPKPLPHLDYKIVVGNSLVSKLEDTIIDIEWDLKPQLVQADIFGNEGKVTQKRELIREITALQKQVFEPDSDEEQLSIAIRNKKIDLLVLQLEIMIDEKGVTDKPQGTGRNITVMTQKWLETKGWQQQIAKLKTMKKGTQTPLEFFDWLLDFPEVMNPEVNKNPGFDIVIGNPPWGYTFEKKDLNVLMNLFPQVSKKTKDSYLYFTLVGLKLTKENAVLSYITPNTWLLINTAKDFRDFVLKFKINRILDYGDGLFESAIVESAIILMKNQISTDNIINTTKYTKQGIIKSELTYSYIQSDSFSRITIGISNEKVELLTKLIDKKDYFFNEVCNIKWGIKPYQKGHGKPPQTRAMIDSRIYHSTIKENAIWKPLVVGTNINRFKLEEPENSYIKYSDGLMYKSNEKMILAPKLLMRQTSDSLRVCYDQEGFYPQNSLFIINSPKINLKFLMGLLNSKLLNFIYCNKNPQKGKVFAEIKPSVVKELPLKISNNSFKFINIIDEILILKDKNLEREAEILIEVLDNLIYKIYNLTYEEALIVEPELATRLTKAAYEAIEI